MVRETLDEEQVRPLVSLSQAWLWGRAADAIVVREQIGALRGWRARDDAAPRPLAALTMGHRRLQA